MGIFSQDMAKARETAGYRERYAMEHGNKQVIYVNGEKCFKFTYNTHLPYQDANGATFNTVRGVWVD